MLSQINGTPWKRRVNLVFQQANKQSRLKGFWGFPRGVYVESHWVIEDFPDILLLAILLEILGILSQKLRPSLKLPMKKITLPATNSEFTSEHGWLGDQFPFGMAYLQGQIVSFTAGIRLIFFAVGFPKRDPLKTIQAFPFGVEGNMFEGAFAVKFPGVYTTEI